jgi:agmatinase
MDIFPVLTAFLDKPVDPLDAEYVLFGAPLDMTTSNRRGARFGPDAIRRESRFLDTFSQRSGLDWDDLLLADIGNIECESVETCLENIESVINNHSSPLPVMLGGEHTITLGALRALKPDLVVVFDAHLDIRDELFGKRLCHATYLRRGYEELRSKVLIVGARAMSRKEVKYAESNDDIDYITSLDIIKNRDDSVVKINKLTKSASRVYISIDLDVLDPAFAPAVGNPHPEGLSTTQLMDIIQEIMGDKVVGFDLNEVYPHFDQGNTATVAAYIVMESLYNHIRSRNER